MSSCITELFKWFSSRRGAYDELKRKLSELGFTVSKINPKSEAYEIYKRIVALKPKIYAMDEKVVSEEIKKIKEIIEEISKKYDLTYSMDGPHWMAGGVLGILIGFK